MPESKNIKIIAFVGLPGAGKSTAVDYLTAKKYPKVYFGGVIYNAMNEAGIEITPESQTVFREEIRAKHGKDFVVNKIIEEIHNLVASGQHQIVADGIYSWTEYKAMKQAFPGELSVVAVVAPRHVRHHRLASRPERPFTEKEATDRDWAEIENLEKGGPIAIADHYVINDKTTEELFQSIDEITDSINF